MFTTPDERKMIDEINKMIAEKYPHLAEAKKSAVVPKPEPPEIDNSNSGKYPEISKYYKPDAPL